MKQLFTLALGLALTVSSFAAAARAQGGGARNGPDPATVRDPEMERDSQKNLEAAKLYFNMRKAYRASLARCEEIIAGDPNYSRIDEVIWFAGMSNLYLSQHKGKQDPDPNIPAAKYEEEARRYLTQLVTEYPDSKFHKKAEEELSKLGSKKSEQ